MTGETMKREGLLVYAGDRFLWLITGAGLMGFRSFDPFERAVVMLLVGVCLGSVARRVWGRGCH